MKARLIILDTFGLAKVLNRDGEDRCLANRKAAWIRTPTYVLTNFNLTGLLETAPAESKEYMEIIHELMKEDEYNYHR